jgi:hypothetical protein
MEIVSQEHKDCIQSLKSYDCEFYRKQLLKKRSGKTCSWIFGHHSYRKWIDTGDSAFLWISGGSGFWKSVLSSVVSDRLECDRPISLENNYLVAHFFFDDKDDRLKSVPAMLTNILGQRLKQDPGLFRHFTLESEYCTPVKNLIASGALECWSECLRESHGQKLGERYFW